MKALNVKIVGWNPPNSVYIGRRKGLINSFGNPFTHLPNIEGTIQVASRDEAIQAFEDWLDGTAWQHVEPLRRQWILDNEYTLKGKDLLCWCDPERCHAEVYIRRLK